MVATEHAVPGPLLQCRRGPSRKLTCRPVIETLLSIIVRIPKGIAPQISTTIPTPHDLVPHISARVYPNCPPLTLYRANQLLNVEAVGLGRPNTP